jgi:hypothetical protein
MFQDMLGKSRMKINFHTHTTVSDGKKTPEEAAALYKAAGYDAIALTDHYIFSEEGSHAGLRLLSGAEYDTNLCYGREGVYHILALGCARDPEIGREEKLPAEKFVERILAAGGTPVLAHPAWSLNQPEIALLLKDVVLTEIYNSVSDAGESSRPYSGCFADLVACLGKPMLLLATDDTHYYAGDDETKCAVMVECAADATEAEILAAVKAGKFYATQGPEVHIAVEGDEIVVRSSPVSRISLFTNVAWAEGYCVRGEGLTEHRHKITPREKFVRAEVTDENGKVAYTNYIVLNK